jgi:putative ABC transport system permease protein
MGIRVDLLEGGKIALYSLRAHRLRTLLTTLGIGIGVCTLLAIIGIIQGLNVSFARQLAQLGSNSMYISKFPWVINGDWWEYRNRRELSIHLVDNLREQVPELSAVAPMTQQNVDVFANGEQLSSVALVGTTAEYPQVSGYDVAEGRFLSEGDDDNSTNVVVLGADVAKGLYPTGSAVGNGVRVNGRPFRVVGVLQRRGKILGENQDLTAMVPLRTYLTTFGKKRGITIGAVVADGADVLRTVDLVQMAVRRARGLPPEKKDDFSINRPEMLANTYAQLTGALYGVATGIGLITLLVGGIGIMNVMLVSVRERTREIGVRRALGARRRTIVTQFLLEAAAVSALGGALGTLVGLSLAKLVSLVTPLAAAVQPLTILGGVGFAAAVGLVFGIWPAARAAQLDPVEALRAD